MRKRKIIVFLLVVSFAVYVFLSRGILGSLVHPLPFEGPYNGIVIDSVSGNPIEQAEILADWWCYDSPDPHLGNYWVKISVTTDKNGRYEISKPRRRGGWFGGSFTLSVNAKGYIPLLIALKPNGPALPAETKAYPFIDTRAYVSLPPTLDIRLNSFKPVLLENLNSENTEYRRMAADELAKIGKSARYAEEPLIQKLTDTSAVVRKYSAKALGKIAHGSEKASHALIKTLNDEDDWVRLESIDAIGSIGTASADVISALIKLLTDKDSSVRSHAVNNLARFGPRAKTAAPVLKDMLGQKWLNKYSRRDIEYALKQIGPDSLVER
jgi:hypothetical protein